MLDEARRAVGDLVVYRNVEFGRPMYLSKVYEAVEALTGVAAANVSRFRRADAAPLPDRLSGRLQALGLGDFQPAIDVVIGGALPAFGRIDIGEFEIAVPGDIEVVVLDSVARPRRDGPDLRARADIVGGRVLVWWRVDLDEGDSVDQIPPVVVRRKQRDFEYPSAHPPARPTHAGIRVDRRVSSPNS